jgi:hypothetical protein
LFVENSNYLPYHHGEIEDGGTEGQEDHRSRRCGEQIPDEDQHTYHHRQQVDQDTSKYQVAKYAPILLPFPVLVFREKHLEQQQKGSGTEEHKQQNPGKPCVKVGDEACGDSDHGNEDSHAEHRN